MKTNNNLSEKIFGKLNKGFLRERSPPLSGGGWRRAPKLHEYTTTNRYVCFEKGNRKSDT